MADGRRRTVEVYPGETYSDTYKNRDEWTFKILPQEKKSSKDKAEKWILTIYLAVNFDSAMGECSVESKAILNLKLSKKDIDECIEAHIMEFLGNDARGEINTEYGGKFNFSRTSIKFKNDEYEDMKLKKEDFFDFESFQRVIKEFNSW